MVVQLEVALFSKFWKKSSIGTTGDIQKRYMAAQKIQIEGRLLRVTQAVVMQLCIHNLLTLMRPGFQRRFGHCDLSRSPALLLRSGRKAAHCWLVVSDVLSPVSYAISPHQDVDHPHRVRVGLVDTGDRHIGRLLPAVVFAHVPVLGACLPSVMRSRGQHRPVPALPPSVELAPEFGPALVKDGLVQT